MSQPDLQTSQYTVWPYHAAVTPHVLALTQETLGNAGAVRKTEEFWNWKHHSSPFGPSQGFYAWSDREERAVGLRVLMSWRFQTPAGECLHAARAVDTATHPDYQRQGIFSTLTKQAVEALRRNGTHLIFNTPNAKSLPGYLKMGWRLVGQWPLYIKPLRPLRMAYRRLRPCSSSTLDFPHYFQTGILTWDAFERQYAQAAQDLVTAWEAQRRRVGLRTHRDWSYLQWRYGRHPHVRYGVYVLETRHTGHLAGFAIVRPNLRFGWQEVVLTELVPDPSDARPARQLLHRLTGQLKADYLIAHFAPHTVERAVLLRSGFLPVPRQGITFTVRGLQPSLPDIAVPAAWDLTLGDLELF